MEHSYFIDRISAYHDRDLPPYELEVVREHLESCEECRRLLTQYEQLDAMVERKSRLDESDYWEESAAKIEQALNPTAPKVTEIKPTRSSGLVWKLAAVAASVAALTFITLNRSEIEESVLDQTAPSKDIPVRIDEETGRTADSTNRLFDEVDSKSEEIQSGDGMVGRKADEVREDAEEAVRGKAQPAAEENLAMKPAVDIGSSIAKSSEKEASASDQVMEADQVRRQEVSADTDIIANLKEKKRNSGSLGGGAVEQPRLSAPEKGTAEKALTPILEAVTQPATTKLKSTSAAFGADDNIAELIALRAQRDSLKAAITEYVAHDIQRKAVADTVAVQERVADSGYNVMLDSLISTVYQIGLVSSDTTEVMESTKYLRNFPWSRTNEQQSRIDKYLSQLQLKLD
ncbi:MAG: zf-HC2 domain-containing protein [bacterium]|nr:zf-HC2 domain-containing protein [bacterium]